MIGTNLCYAVIIIAAVDLVVHGDNALAKQQNVSAS